MEGDGKGGMEKGKDHLVFLGPASLMAKLPSYLLLADHGS